MQKQNPLQHISIVLLLSLFYIFCPLFAPDLFSEDDITSNIKVVSSVNKRHIGIGEEIRYRVSAYLDPAVKLEMPALKEIGNFQVKNSWITRRKAFDRDAVNVWYVLVIYETGEQVIPGINIRYRRDEGPWQNVESKKIDIYVESVFERYKIEADIKPIESPIGFIYPYTLHILISSILFLVGSYLIFVLIKRRKKVLADSNDCAGQRVLFYNQLCKQAEIVSRNNDIRSDDFIKFADLVKRYLGLVLNIGNYEFTTEEFLNIARGHKKLFDKYGEELSFLLRVSDLVKFANYKPKPAERKEATLFIDNLIHDLAP